CPDSDGDGLDDELDAFPFDATETIDSDGDGVGDNLDAYPQDSTKTVVESADDESNIINIAIIGGTILALIIVIGLYTKRRKSNVATLHKNQTSMMEPIFGLEPVVMQQPNVIAQAPTMPQSPPLPPEGLPPGWTMEQWNWYGDDYLRNQ
ncbi:MAG: hypothetical protein MKZ57_06960, partial [Candidatus Poseidoniaceae archaeon]|nr:hypothetical protein [Candidatus Poseidoniaceae archaeon]